MVDSVVDENDGLVQRRLSFDSIVRLGGGRTPRIRISITVQSEDDQFALRLHGSCAGLHESQSRRFDSKVAPSVDPLDVGLARVRQSQVFAWWIRDVAYLGGEF